MRSLFSHQTQTGLRAFFLIFLAIVLMIMDKRWESFTPLRAEVSVLLMPLQFLVSGPTKFVETMKVYVQAQDELVKENFRLKANQLQFRSQLQRLTAIESENNYLKSLMQSSRKIKNKTLIAELLAVATEPFVNQVILDKGSRHGVYVGQPVLDANGVMGQVIQAGPVTSRVLLINDPHSGVAVQGTRNGIRSVVGGDSYSDKLRLLYLSKTADIRVGDIFVTSGLGDRYPAGYPVGKVIKVIKDPAQQFATVYLQPSAHLTSSRQVLLVWYQRNA